MSLKDILVLVDGTARAAVRIDIAVGLAQRFGARLVGLFGQIEKSSPSIVARRASAGYLETITSPLTLSSALHSISSSLGWTTMSFSADPRLAEIELCGQP